MEAKQAFSYIAILIVLSSLCGLLVIKGYRERQDYLEFLNEFEEIDIDESTNSTLSNRELRYLLRTQKCEYIDAVFTWVNGSDKSFQKTLRNYSTTRQNHRFNDYGTLRFSIRSVIKNVKNLRNIYVVTNGQRPSWLSTEDPRVKLVTHEEIFTGKHRDYLPTFNSNTIELHLHNIPNLSECFLYLNDDFIVQRQIGLDYFISDPQKQLMNLYFDKKYVAPKHRKIRSLWHIRSTYTNILLNKHYHPSNFETEHRYACHNAYFFRKTLIRHIYSIWNKEIEASASHRFRNTRDAMLTFMHNNVALEEGLGKSKKCDTVVVSWGNDHKKNEKGWKGIPFWVHSFCLQDGFRDTTGRSYEREVGFLTEKLCKMFPDKSFAESGAEQNPCM